MHEVHEAQLLRSPLFASHGLHGIFSLRRGGVSPPPFDSLNLAGDDGDDAHHAEQNLTILLQASGIRHIPHRARQVHGSNTLVCAGEGRQHETQADILISRDGSPLAVRIADCTPVLLADPSNNLLAAVHAGWRGTAAGAVRHGMAALLAAGARKDALLASIGPCIGPCCFEIGIDTANQLARSCPDAEDLVQQRNGRLFADLAGINRLQLQHAGIAARQIEMPSALMPPEMNACTCCNSPYFFSYRRDGQESGRHLAIVAPISCA